jgi:hypothetical protein
MTSRSPYLSIVTFLLGGLMLSVGFNIIQHEQIQKLQNSLCQTNKWVTDFELKQLENEIKRLDQETKSVLKRD